MLDEETKQKIEATKDKHPFLTFLVFTDGTIKTVIVQNESQKMIHLYDYEKIQSPELSKIFLKFGDEWWWGSNQSIPIDAFLGDDFDQFCNILVGYPKKMIEEIHGPTFSLQEIYLKRVKRKKIEICNIKVT